jgi:hypothetical protein|tara:strand:- start:813 stop:956 length:144 start_codon:yes stop_codon:yes gene_type:complete
MPKVGNKKFPYTAAGKKAAAQHKKKKKKNARAQAAANLASKMGKGKY